MLERNGGDEDMLKFEIVFPILDKMNAELERTKIFYIQLQYFARNPILVPCGRQLFATQSDEIAG